MAQLTVTEASEAYQSSMRVVQRAGPGICATCKTFIEPGYQLCYRCNQLPEVLDAVVPITYSEHLGQIHTALRNYKDAPEAAARYAQVRLTGILWRFIGAHESCVSREVGIEAFDLVTTVPSSTLERDDLRSALRTVVGWCQPVADRFERVLAPTGRVPPGREFNPDRYHSSRDLSGRRVLLVDDTWASGGHAQSAATALKAAGATTVALIVIGRHVRPDWQVTEGETSGDLLEKLPRQFDWNICAVH